MKKFLILFSVLLLVLFVQDLATPQMRGMRREGGKGPRKGHEMVETLRIWNLVDRLDLSEEQLVKLLPKLKEEKELRREYGEARREALGELKELLEELEEGEVSEKEIKVQLQELEKVDSEFQGKTKALRNQTKKLLSVKQQAQFYIANQEFQKELRHMLGEMRGMRGRSGEGRPRSPQREEHHRD